MTAKRKRPVSEDTGNWTELKFERSGGFKTKYHSLTLKSSKYGVHLYKTDLQADQNVKLFKNGNKVGIVAVLESVSYTHLTLPTSDLV